MDVLMEVLLEFPQTVIERVKGSAGIRWSGEIPAQSADFSDQGTRCVVFLRHHRDRIRNRAKATTGPRGSNGDRPLHGGRVWTCSRAAPTVGPLASERQGRSMQGDSGRPEMLMRESTRALVSLRAAFTMIVTGKWRSARLARLQF